MPSDVKNMISSHLNQKELKDLKKLLKDAGLKQIPVKSPYEEYRFSDEKNNVPVIAYRSGNVVHKGEAFVKELIDRVMEREEGFDYILGTDEAGKGEWAGPLVIACTALTPGEIRELRTRGVKDSKKLSPKALKDIGYMLLESGIKKDCLSLKPETYNRKYDEFRREGKNVNDLMAWAHSKLIRKALKDLRYKKARVFIDVFDYGKTKQRLKGLENKSLEVIQKKGAESEIPVAAASIIAKYVYEKEVDRLNREYSTDLRKVRPEELPKETLHKVAKMHFRNVP
ncbi:MAG: hypothetical protein JW724_00500 [Candidatus Altiarchaeota archaeon]|nr:hypothetical protein [Candidatus Altiarchaeota archaeon]